MDLTLQAPLVLPEDGALALQLSVGEPDESGQRPVGIYSRLERAVGDAPVGEERVWTCHATGVLASQGPQAAQEQVSLLAGDVWPPAGAEVVQLEGFYDRLADEGLEYGPVFQGLSAVWRRGDDLFAEVALPEEQFSQASRYAVHPALLDAALHPMLAIMDIDGGGHDGPGSERDAGGRMRLPFSWSGVGLHATGASRLRVGLTPSGSDAISLVVADEHGAPIASVQLSRVTTGFA